MTRAHAFSWSGFESKAGSSCRLLGKKASPRKTINIQDCITILHGYLLVLTFPLSRQHLMASQASFHPPATGLVWEDPLQHRGSCQLWKPPSMSHQRTTTRDHNYEHYGSWYNYRDLLFYYHSINSMIPLLDHCYYYNLFSPFNLMLTMAQKVNVTTASIHTIWYIDTYWWKTYPPKLQFLSLAKLIGAVWPW